MKKSATPEIITKGICSFCKGEFDKPKMSQHLRNCKERKGILARLATDETKQKKRLFHIQAEGRYAPEYWMHLEIPAEATLDDLDNFLRDMWFEHYEHLSGFKIDDTSYSSEEREDFFFLDGLGESSEEITKKESEEKEEGEIVENYIDGEKLLAALPPIYLKILPSDVIATLKQEWFLYDLLPFLKEKQKITYHQVVKLFNEKVIDEARLAYSQNDAYKLMISLVEDRSTTVQLQYILKVEKKFYYTYDYGDSTYLTLRVVSEREGIIRDEEDPVELLALNVAPEIPCIVCGKPATQVVAGSYYVMEHAYCDECVKNLDDKKEEEEEEEEEEYLFGEEESFVEIENTPRVGIVS
ncbi:MAG TPA: hypothetical protein VII61_00260 [Ktedonobacteraceae bacterium]